ncbi:hypothetical protein Nepgr_001269 [Nepenthes gracilis]|uniref:Uncharacterized protein n=1 Tax=Nepenthes gracilis TaxID=150966 RepID=A0AAD3P2H4_NEPGR|nr:hypothetical protein Nepgr_001269 [Nepenthes gracilis]
MPPRVSISWEAVTFCFRLLAWRCLFKPDDDRFLPSADFFFLYTIVIFERQMAAKVESSSSSRVPRFVRHGVRNTKSVLTEAYIASLRVDYAIPGDLSSRVPGAQDRAHAPQRVLLRCTNII